MKDDYAGALEVMDKFIDVYLDQTDLGEHLVRALLEVIYLDEDIDDEMGFYMQLRGGTICKEDLLDFPKLNARQFLLSVWHFIITRRGCENTGRQSRYSSRNWLTGALTGRHSKRGSGL